jgi:enoyl-CoA hydratase/carnithine racemase
MNTLDAGGSDRSRGSETCSQSWTHLRLDRRSPNYCRVTFDHPPINAITATTVAELAELVGLIEADLDLNVVVFDSASPHFYLAQYDAEHTTRAPAWPRADPAAWPDLLERLSLAAVISIALIRGRVRGEGIEFVLACDLRFASRERSRLGQFGVVTAGVPKAGPGVRVPPPIGRARALEILLAADDSAGPGPERYGYLNRTISDDRLEHEVEAIAARLARFDQDAIARAKSCVDWVTPPSRSGTP